MELELLSAALPFLGEELLAEDVRYSGLGVTLQGRDAYAAATAAWSRGHGGTGSLRLGYR